MPWNNNNQIVVGGNGQVSIGAVGATAPVDISSTLAAGTWSQIGVTTEEGATITDSKDITDINIWQSFYPARKLITARVFEVAFGMRQWNGFNVKLAFGGGTIASQGGGKWSFTPPGPGVIDTRALVLDWQDGTKNYRLYDPQGLATAPVETALVRTDSAVLAVTFSALSDGVTSPYSLFTDDPAFNQSS